MATINGHDWVEQNGFHLQMWEVPKLGRIVLFKPAAGAGYWDGYVAAKGYVAQFDPEIFLIARKSADTGNWVESHRIADEAIASYQKKLESTDRAWSCWDSYSADDIQYEDDEVAQELREEYWAAVDECESNRESGWTECDVDQLDDRVGTGMQISGRQIDDEEADGESPDDDGQVISIDINDDEARINEEVRVMNHEAQVGLGTRRWSAEASKSRGGRLASIHIRRSTGEINVSICL